MASAATTAPDARAGRHLTAVRLVINPDTDATFVRRAESLAETAVNPEDLQRSLRATYERASVVRGVTDIVERWYVYRDGRWVNASGR